MVKKTGREMPKGKKANSRATKPSATRHAKTARTLSARAKKARLEERRALRMKAKKRALKEQAKLDAEVAEREKIRIDGLLDNVVFADFISKNVGKKAINVIKMLHSPQTDEKIAADLSVKINEIRRILNVLDSYGVARYDTNKDNKGWLTFKWYLDGEKLTELHQNTLSNKHENAYRMPENCNDFFYCGKCYQEAKVILPFDAAFESQFRCDGCGKQLKQLSKEEARALFEEEAAREAVTGLPA